jgi:hypothetical protein
MSDVLHCYAQAFPHGDAYLSGGRGALLALRATIDKALHDGAGACDLFTSDGEGYTVHVVAMTDADAEHISSYEWRPESPGLWSTFRQTPSRSSWTLRSHHAERT